jgi:cellulose synthase/poly-beta-1,6-N-acetylglucosamine synthase-like glycosyltransferase
MLCSTGDENQEFCDELNTIAREHGFRTWYDKSRGTRAIAKRETGGTKRDLIVRNVLLSNVITECYIITLDADTVPGGPLSLLAGEMARRELDAASVRIIPGNAQDSILTRLQQLEYFVAMRIRYVSPWLLSGACHVARTEVWRDVMMRHSLFFQGNDVEAGLIAEARGYRVGHIPFDILTEVPSTFWPWLRQRLAWAGGQVRLFIVNIRFGAKHPFMWLYGAGLTYLAIAFRWQLMIIPNARLLAVAAAYIALVWYLYLNRSAGRWWVLVMPFYMVVNAFIITPLGLIWYFKMALGENNWGLIHPSREVPR